MALSAGARARGAKALTEFIGTFFLCLTVAMSAKASPIAPVAIGCALMVCIYAGGHISGAHYNPAVTLAVCVRGGGKLSLTDGALYVASQVVGALVATLFSWAMIGDDASGYAAPDPNAHVLSLCLCELLITFALCSVVLHTATTEGQAGNSFFGLAIGFTVLSGAVSVGAVSGGAFNPAVGTMSLFYGADPAWDVWAYWVAPLCGGAAAGGIFRVAAWREYREEASRALEVLAPCLVELIGTTMLCFTVGTAQGALAPLAIGSMLMVMIYMGGWISGGHFNPAVTLAVWARSLFGATHGVLTWRQAARYVSAQLGGAVLGALAAWGARADRAAVLFPVRPSTTSVGEALLGELLGTFLLAYVVLHTATAKRTSGNSFFGLAIGMVVTAMACAIGPVSGAFNPAVGTMGLVLEGRSDLWIYWLACPLGAVLAAGCFRLQSAEDFRAEAAWGGASNAEVEGSAEVGAGAVGKAPGVAAATGGAAADVAPAVYFAPTVVEEQDVVFEV